MRRRYPIDLKAPLEDLVDRTGRAEDMLEALASIYRERARHPEYIELRDQMEQAAHVMHEASEAVARIFDEEDLEHAAGQAAWQAAHEEGRRNPRSQLDELIQGLPATAHALSTWLDRQQPRRSLESKVEAVLFHAVDGGAVEDLDAWTDAVTDGGSPDDLGPALRKLLRRSHGSARSSARR